MLDSVLRNYPSKFVGCCLANPAEDGSGVRQLEDLVLKVSEEFIAPVMLLPMKVLLSNKKAFSYDRMVIVPYALIHICGHLVNR